MAAPSRMPQYYVSNDGMGPYARFICERDSREYRSQPSIAQTVKDNIKEDVKGGIFAGLMRNVPIVGDEIANRADTQRYNDQYRSDMSAEELNSAWAQIQQYFRECPTCHQIVCVPDFDETTGFCNEHTPRAGQIAEAQARQAAGMMKGIADAFGVTDAVKASAAQAQQQPAQGGAPSAGGKFCSNCGTALAADARFCANCGTAAA